MRMRVSRARMWARVKGEGGEVGVMGDGDGCGSEWGWGWVKGEDGSDDVGEDEGC